ncbi:MAG: OmpA family protein [Waterburya sp.]
MFINSAQQKRIAKVLLTAISISSLIPWQAQQALGQSNLQSFKVVVNSDRDLINPDQELTLREAIAIVNNTLPWAELSLAEQEQVTTVDHSDASRIEFDLNTPVKIELESILPPLISPGLVIDGTTHSDYDLNHIATAEIPIPVPVVSLTAVEGKNIFRGLTIVGDRITIKGLSIYGFSQPNQPTDTIPGADIVVSSRLPMESESLQPYVSENPPLNVEIIDNWLGLPPDESLQEIPSSFGIWLFDGENTKIQRNRIYHHGGSGILTSVDVRGSQIRENIIVGNGLMGMPHAIYLEGSIDDSVITDNLLCGNDGSGIYLFKPEGSIKINRNQIKFNGRRVPSAAVYLMGNDHQVINNQISWQTGTGVTIAAYPRSDRNFIKNNTFTDLEGLSIDLNTRDHTSKPFFKLGDGINPPRNSANRKRDTANRAINAPQFMSTNFYLIDDQVYIDGIADPGAKITLYQVEQPILRDIESQSPLASQSENYGPLSQPLTDVIADKLGRFTFSLQDIAPGQIISAIASKSDSGTSEPAFNAVINSFDQIDSSPPPNVTIPNCTTKPVAEISQPPAELEISPPEQPIILRVPRNIHFALDKSNISPPTAKVLDQMALVLKEHPYLTIELQGHTDFRASNQYNLALSKKRAIATRNYLLQQGVQPERMTILPLGESQLKKSGNTILEHAYNRRVEIIFHDLRGANIIFEEQDSDLQPER